ncbi:amino acid adenylation domain-containing protein [Staphylococcus caprae]|uniref:amino acid adenylation domain-containing protein n=2 Tax=Staphylococcus TaxID=1279 RepID=UPI0030BB010C
MNNNYRKNLLAEKFWKEFTKKDYTNQIIHINYQRANKPNIKVIEYNFSKEAKFRIKNLTQFNEQLIVTLLLSALNIQMDSFSFNSDFIIHVDNPRNKELLKSEKIPFSCDVNINQTVKELILNVEEKLKQTYSNYEFASKNFKKIIDRMESQFYLSINKIDGANPPINNEIELNINTKKDLSITVKYNRFNYHEDIIKSWFESYLFILHQIIENPNEIIKKIEVTPSEKRQEIINYGQGKKRIFPKNIAIKEIFEQIVEKHSSEIAISKCDEKITYRELNEKSNSFANKLIDKGVKNNDVVAILADKDIQTIIAMVAVIKIGATYLPVDIDYPKNRIKYMLNDSKCSIVIGREGFKDMIFSFKKKSEISFININERKRIFNKENISLPNAIDGEAIAYIIYTSGSTGHPKGICIKNKSLINVTKEIDYLDISSKDILLQVGSLSFDASVQQIWLALLNGAELNIIDKKQTIDFDFLSQHILTNNISILIFPTPLFNQFSRIHPSTFKNVKQVISGGDVISQGDVKKILNNNKNLTVINGYGPSENTIISSSYKMTKIEDVKNNIPIGKPIVNTNAIITDYVGRVLPIGIPGELLLSGDGLAKGYLNLPEMTKESFIYSENLKSKAYKTGDLVSYDSEGNMLFLGRIDNQVKIRGYRIELNEILNIIKNIKGIKEAAVIDRVDKQGNKNLIVYYVINDNENNINEQELRNKLSELLPNYMLPQIMIKLDRLPTLPNGKIDYSKLKSMNIVQKKSLNTNLNDLEKEILKVWVEVLGIANIDVNSNFFEMGGDSIKSIQITAKLRKKNIITSVNDILKCKTISELAKCVKLTKYNNKEVVKEGELKSSPVIKMFLQNNSVEDLSGFVQYKVIQLDKAYNINLIKKVLLHLVKNHSSLRINVKKDGTLFYKKYDETDYDIQSYKISENNLTNSLQNIAKYLQKSIVLYNTSIIKVANVETEKRNFLLFVINHIAIDSVSWQTFLEDFEDSCLFFKKYEKLPELLVTDSYKLWTEKISSYNPLPSIESYWKKIDKSTDNLQLLDLQKNKRFLSDCNNVFEIFTEIDTNDLTSHIHKKYKTDINDILLVSLMRAMYKWKKYKIIKVLLESHGREELISEVDISRTIGWFTSVYPVILDNFNNNLKEQIISIKENLRKIPNRGFDYGILKFIKESIDSRDSYNAKISLNYLGEILDSKESVFTASKYNFNLNNTESIIVNSNLQINCWIENKKLNVAIDYLPEEFELSNIQEFLKIFQKELKKVINHCNSQEFNEMITPSDYGTHELTINDINELSHYFEKNGSQKDSIVKINKLSPMQKGILFNYLKNKTSSEYLLISEYNIKGNFDANAYGKAFNLLCKKHKIFNTRIYNHWKEPLQVILKDGDPDFYYLDLSIYSNPHERYFQYIKKVKEKGINIFKESLIKIMIFKMTEEEYRMMIVCHHIIIDGWSNSILLNELNGFYKDIINECDFEVTEKYDYEKYIKWLNNRDYNEGLKKWERYLSDINFIPRLSQKMSCDNEGSQNICSKTLNEQLSQKLKKVASQNGLTINTICQLCWALILKTYTAENDVIFDNVVHGRPEEIEDYENVIGLFINTIPIRVNNAENLGFTTLLKQIQSTNIKLQKYSYLPLNEIRKLIKANSDRIESLFVFENYPNKKEWNLEFDIHHIKEHEQTNYPINIIFEQKNDIKVTIIYDDYHFSKSFINQISNNLIYLLKNSIDHIKNNTSLNQVNLTSRRDLQVLYDSINGNFSNFQQNKSLVQLFNEQLSQNPRRDAVEFEGFKLTYNEVNNLSNYIAKCILDKKPDGKFIAFESMQNYLVVPIMLGILKAGYGYLPIDFKNPLERIQYIIEDSSCNMYIYFNNKIEDINITHDLYFDYDKVRELNYKDVECSSCDVAYIMYTSGTTGKPKGVEISHKNIHCLVKDNFIFLKNSRILQTGSLAFDASTFEIWGPLLNGGTIIFPNKGTLSNPCKLKQIILEKDINIMWLTSALYNQLVNIDYSVFDNLNILIIGGEKLSSYHVNLLRNNNSNIKIVNGYGPTETTTFALMYEIKKTIPKNIPIGKPLSNTKIQVINNNQLCGIDMPGELCIAGDRLSNGYLNNEMLNEKNFVYLPEMENKERYYKTGDIVRILSSGDIEYIRRKDNQVKYNGFRIELDEISNAMKSVKGIENALAAVKMINTNKVLCGYYISGGNIETQYIKNHLKSLLPDYMIPNIFMRLDEIPITLNGKINQEKLPNPTYKMVENKEDGCQIYNNIEKIMVKTWEEVLGVSNIDRDTNFFNVGGDSIKSIQIVAKLREYELVVEVRDVMKYKTVKEISLHVKSMTKQDNQGDVEGYISSTPIFQYFSTDVSLKTFSHFNQSQLVYFGKNINIPKLKKAIRYLFKHHDALRITINDSFQRVNSSFDNFKIEITEKKYNDNCDYKKLLKKDAESIQQSLNLKDSLSKIRLYHTPRGLYLFWCIHHSVVDGVSWQIILDDLSKFYSSLKEYECINLPLKSTSFLEWSHYLTEYADTLVNSREIVFWKDVLDERTIQLVDTRLISGNSTLKDMKSYKLYIDKERTNYIKYKINQSYNTEINDILLSILARSLQHWTKSLGKVRVLLEGHGREKINDKYDLTRTVGWFTTFYPVNIDFTSKNLEDIIIQNKEMLRKIPNKGFNYGILASTNKDNKLPINLDKYVSIAFNYLGDYDLNNSQLKIADINVNNSASSKTKIIAPIHINSYIQDEVLYFDIDFNEKCFEKKTIKNFVDSIQFSLNEIVNHCTELNKTHLTPRDYGINMIEHNDINEIAELMKVRTDEIENINKLKPIQLGMLYSYLKNKNTKNYLVSTDFEISGFVDCKKLQKVYRYLMNKYEILRTNIVNHWRAPVQVVLKDKKANIDYHDFSMYENSYDICENYLLNKRNTPFQLDKDDLFKISLIKINKNRYKIALFYHHIIMDGWSNSILFKELFDLYNSEISTGHLIENKLPKVEEYIEWLDKQNMNEAYNYWKKELGDYKSDSSILIEPENISNEKEIEKESHVLSFETSNLLKKFAKKNNTTLNDIFEVLWGVTIQKWRGISDIVFGKVVSGRQAPIKNIEKAVDIFVNNILARIITKSSSTFLDLIIERQKNNFEAEKYSFLSLIDIQKASGINLDLIDIAMVYENYPKKELENTLSEKKYDYKIEKSTSYEQSEYDLSAIFLDGENIEIILNYNKSRYSIQTIQNLKLILNDILSIMLKDPNSKVEDTDPLLDRKLDDLHDSIKETSKRINDYSQMNFDL